MLNIEEVNNTIEELENSPTTFDTCLKLSSLYIVRDNYKRPENRDGSDENNHVNNEVVKELNDILPQYKEYCEVKRKYQLKEVSEQAVIKHLTEVCREIQEFIDVLYSSTDFNDERHIIVETLLKLSTKYV